MSWNPTHGIPRRDEAGGGGAAVAERLPTPSSAINRTGGTMSPRTVAVLITDTVELGGTKITGEVEPRHDPLYERQTVHLVRDGDHMTNSNELEFRSSVDWPGPMAAFVVYDGEGNMTHRCDINGAPKIPADYVFALRERSGSFVKCKRSD